MSGPTNAAENAIKPQRGLTVGASFLEAVMAGVDRRRLVRGLNGDEGARVTGWFDGTIIPEPATLQELIEGAETLRPLGAWPRRPLALLLVALGYGHVRRDAILDAGIRAVRSLPTHDAHSIVLASELLAAIAILLPARIEPRSPTDIRERLQWSYASSLKAEVPWTELSRSKTTSVRTRSKRRLGRYLEKLGHRAPHLDNKKVQVVVEALSCFDALLGDKGLDAWLPLEWNRWKPRVCMTSTIGQVRRKERERLSQLAKPADGEISHAELPEAEVDAVFAELDDIEPQVRWIARHLLDVLRPLAAVNDDSSLTAESAAARLHLAGVQRLEILQCMVRDHARANRPVQPDDAPLPGPPSSR